MTIREEQAEVSLRYMSGRWGVVTRAGRQFAGARASFSNEIAIIMAEGEANRRSHGRVHF